MWTRPLFPTHRSLVTRKAANVTETRGGRIANAAWLAEIGDNDQGGIQVRTPGAKEA